MNFAKPSTAAKVVLRVREMTDDEKAKARWDQAIMHQRKLSENWRLSDDEIAKLTHDALYGNAT